MNTKLYRRIIPFTDWHKRLDSVRGKNIQSTWLHFTPNFSQILCWIFFVLNLMRATCHLSHRSWKFSPRLQVLISYIDLYWYSYKISFIISHFCKNRLSLRLLNKMLKTVDLECNIRPIYNNYYYFIINLYIFKYIYFIYIIFTIIFSCSFTITEQKEF